MDANTKEVTITGIAGLCAAVAAIGAIQAIAGCCVSIGEQRTREHETTIKFKTEALKAGYQVNPYMEVKKL